MWTINPTEIDMAYFQLNMFRIKCKVCFQLPWRLCPHFSPFHKRLQNSTLRNYILLMINFPVKECYVWIILHRGSPPLTRTAHDFSSSQKLMFHFQPTPGKLGNAYKRQNHYLQKLESFYRKKTVYWLEK